MNVALHFCAPTALKYGHDVLFLLRFLSVLTYSRLLRISTEASHDIQYPSDGNKLHIQGDIQVVPKV